MYRENLNQQNQDSLLLDLDGFEGPIDLLLNLAREQKVDLSSISILQLADQYINFIQSSKKIDIEIAADYLVMAAWLAYLKSRLLIPEIEDEENYEEIMDITEELKKRLQRLEAMQETGKKIFALPKLGEHRFKRGTENRININMHANPAIIFQFKPPGFFTGSVFLPPQFVQVWFESAEVLEKIVWQSLHFSCVTSDIF